MDTKINSQKSKAIPPVDVEEQEVSYTLFYVLRETRESRSKRIREFFKIQPVLGYLMAVIDFEWTIRRAIVMMSGCPAGVIKRLLETKKYSGWREYKDCWRICVEEMRGVGMPTLEHVVFGGTITGEKQEAMCAALLLRHRVVHGQESSLPKDKAKEGLEVIIGASENIVQFVDKHYGKPMFSRIHKPRIQCSKCLRRLRCRFPQARDEAQTVAEERRARRRQE